MEGKARSLPPNAELDVMLDERTYNRLKKASDAGDTLRIIKLDYQPLEEAEEPAASPNGAGEVERRTFTDPALPPEQPVKTEEPSAPEPERVRPKSKKGNVVKKGERVRRSGAVQTKGL
jgi:hypothetical protein